MSTAGADRLALIDHHVHGVVTEDLDRAGFENLISEASGPPAPGTSSFDSQLGFTIRRWCAPVLDLAPSVAAEDYLRRRAELGAAEVNRRLLTASRVTQWLVDTGFRTEQITTPEQMTQASGAPASYVVRLEAVAERVARAGTTAADWATAFVEELGVESAATGAVGYKSIVAYRYGFDFDPARPASVEVTAAAGRLLRAMEIDPSARIEDPVLLRHLIWTAIDVGRPLQFHVGFGDTDVRLHRSDPSLLTDFLIATEPIGTPVMLLHCYPHQRAAGYLAHVFSHVYMDLGAILNYVGARSAAVLAEALELTPFGKMLYSSDAFGLPELHYLGAIGFRRDLAKVTGQFVSDGAWAAADAERVGELIGSANATRVYRLGQS
ncbi:MAG TPA: amidohydrolase family protein [Streptosporangiaceae bacterium]|nr:amidohydrolase family protein [Streptosporangiaceae bacterium]